MHAIYRLYIILQTCGICLTCSKATTASMIGSRILSIPYRVMYLLFTAVNSCMAGKVDRCCGGMFPKV